MTQQDLGHPPLSGLAALVTGCGRPHGMGRAIALELAWAGADVVISDVRSDGARNDGEPSVCDEPAASGLQALADEIGALGRRALVVLGDISDPSDVERMFATARATFPTIGILVNNAAAPHGRDRNWSWQVTESAYDDVMRVNTKGTFLMSTEFVRHRLEQPDPAGRIVNIASDAGRHGFPQKAAYCASKAGVISLTQVMAVELASHGITVNAVCPGVIETARSAASKACANRGGRGSEEARPPVAPIGRPGHPHDIARAVRFFAEPAASYITGQSLNVDGGLILS